jgi:acetylornithine deacetylase
LAVDRWVGAHRGELVGFLSELVQTRSDVTPPVANEAECQRVVEAAFHQAGLEVDAFGLEAVPGLREHPLTMIKWDGMDRPLEGRPDVVGRIPGRGGGRSLLISCHVDTVGAKAEEWTSGAPFSGRVCDGRLFGRGSWDTKWGIATGLYAARCIKELGLQLRGDLIVESVVDEEFGGSHGVMAARLRGHNAEAAINCEPTSMVVGTAHRGGGEWRVTVRGADRGRAFGDDRASSAVEKLAATIEAVSRWNDERNQARSPSEEFAECGELPACIEQVSGGGCSYGEATGAPPECSLVVWVEEEPGVSEADHRAAFVSGVNERLKGHGAFSDGLLPEYRPTIRYIPGSRTGADGLTEALSGAFRSCGLAFRAAGVPLACDSYMFNLYFGTPALTLGPRGGNAHAADEFVELDDVVSLVKVFVHTALEWCG